MREEFPTHQELTLRTGTTLTLTSQISD